MSEWHTHQPFLLHYAKKTSGVILELGMGDGSTPSLHELCQKQQRKLISIDHDPEWVGKFTYLKSNFHSILCVSDWNETYAQINDKFSIVFVDNAPFEARSDAIRKFKNDTEFVILHDCDYFPRSKLMNYDEFKYFHVYAPPVPPTLVGSMFRQDVDDQV